VSAYIPWSADAQLSEPATGRTYVGPLRDCVWAYLELDRETRQDALILSDADVPLDGGRISKVLEFDQIEWLIDRLGSDVYRPKPRAGYWKDGRTV
jgi:hypothetical protein